MFRCINCGEMLDDENEDDLCLDCLMEENGNLLLDEEKELDFDFESKENYPGEWPDEYETNY